MQAKGCQVDLTNALTQFTVTTNNPGWTEALNESSQFPAQEHRAQPSLEPGPVNVETNSILAIHKLFTLGSVAFFFQQDTCLH